MRLGDTEIEIVDPVADYQELMARLFDFERIAALFASGFRIRFDAHVGGHWAVRAGDSGADARCPAGTVINGEPLEDFGGHHPDPNLAHAQGAGGCHDGAGCAGLRRSLGWRW